MFNLKTSKFLFPVSFKKFTREIITKDLGHIPKLPFDLSRYSISTTPNRPYETYLATQSSDTTRRLAETEDKTAGHTFVTLPITITKAEGPYIFDEQNRKYLDGITGISAVNQGHMNKTIIDATLSQLQTVYHVSRCVYTPQVSDASSYITSLLGYDKLLFMNSGLEATENACKYARRWGYTVKGVAKDKARILMFNGNFWGRSIAASSGSSDVNRKHQIGPLAPGFDLVAWNDITAVAKYLTKTPDCVAIMAETILGEAGVILPKKGFLEELSKLCKKHNVLLISDEVHAGMGRAGALMAYQRYGIKPDLVTVGKSFSGGVLPVSGLLGNKEVIDIVQPGWNGSTFAGSSLAAAVCKAAVKTTVDEELSKNSLNRGMELGIYMKVLLGNNKLVKEVRGRGLMVAIEFWPNECFNAWHAALAFMEAGLVTRTTKSSFIRIYSALTITSEETLAIAKIVAQTLKKAEEKVGNSLEKQETSYDFDEPNEEALSESKQWGEEVAN